MVDRCLDGSFTRDDAPPRLWSRFMDLVPMERTQDRCWTWPMSCHSAGYGQLGVSEKGKTVNFLAHRLSFVWFVGPIPSGMTVDHMCRDRKCFNPAHLRLLTRSENASNNSWKLKTHCPQGHAYDAANTILKRGSTRDCRTCHNDRRRFKRAS